MEKQDFMSGNFRPWRTAFKRNAPSKPVRFLMEKGWIDKNERIIDYGAGYGFDVDYLKANGYSWVDGYDIHSSRKDFYEFYDQIPEDFYDVAMLNYVLNVVPEYQQASILGYVSRLLKWYGRIFVTVRRDIERGTKVITKADGTFHILRFVELSRRDGWLSIYKDYRCEVYVIFNLSLYHE